MSFTWRRLSIVLTVVAGAAMAATTAMGATETSRGAALQQAKRAIPHGAALESAERANPRATRTSAMGARAAAEVARIQRNRAAVKGGTTARAAAIAGAPAVNAAALRVPQDDDACQNDPGCGRGFREDGPRGGQAEISIAIDSTGQHIVVGFNDQRGFALNPLSVSGFMYSDDGGNTFVDGGQLPSPGDTDIGGTLLPQVFGDPEVKYLGGCTFVYSSIILATNPDSFVAQTMGVHRSTDCGHTWTGPFEVIAATNPTSFFDGADKEFMDVDPDTRRLMITWTNFQGDGNVAILSAFSDDGGLTWPAANRRTIADTISDGQSSVPRFAGNGSSNVYVAWRRFPFPGTLFGYGNTVGFARSTDNGNTWQAPIETSAEFLTQDYILGNDRSNTSPSLAVDNSHGHDRGHIYLVHPNNNGFDGSDIAFQRSTDGGLTFSAPILLNSRPGTDRAQWFPWVTVDNVTGRVSVFYYDQGIASSGDLSEVTYTFSNDGGRKWSKPQPLTFKPFHAGHNNDTGQPNLGDYIQAVSQDDEYYAGFALANRPELGFADGQPDLALTGIDATVRRVRLSKRSNYASLNVGAVTLKDGRGKGKGFVDPGETVDIKVPLFNYVTNPLNREKVRSPTAVLVSDTPGVTVIKSEGNYETIEPGATRSNSKPYRIRVDRSVVPGTPINLRLLVSSRDDAATLMMSLDTGTPVSTTILSENFDGVAPGALPAGWTAVHGAGDITVPWTTSNTFCGGASNGAFHADGVGSPFTRWERLRSPLFDVPANAQYVLVEFDVCYDTEDDFVLPTLAYDGFFLRVTDLTPGRTVRSVLAEAFEDEFTTGSVFHYPKHFPRSSNPSYFEDMSAWAGDSGGVKHVRMRLPGMQGSRVQLRFEYTQDPFVCTDVRPGSAGCGVFFDNVVVKSVVK